MFIVSSTQFGITPRLLAYQQFAQAIAGAATVKGAPTDRSQIYEVSAATAGAAISALNSGRGVFVDALAQPSPAHVAAQQRSANAAKAQIMAAMTSALLAKSAGERR
jgi:hypothetical protein